MYKKIVTTFLAMMIVSCGGSTTSSEDNESSSNKILGSWSGTINGNRLIKGEFVDPIIPVHVAITIKHDPRFALPYRGKMQWSYTNCSFTGKWAGTGGRAGIAIIGKEISGYLTLKNNKLESKSSGLTIFPKSVGCKSEAGIITGQAMLSPA